MTPSQPHNKEDRPLLSSSILPSILNVTSCLLRRSPVYLIATTCKAQPTCNSPSAEHAISSGQGRVLDKRGARGLAVFSVKWACTNVDCRAIPMRRWPRLGSSVLCVHVHVHGYSMRGWPRLGSSLLCVHVHVHGYSMRGWPRLGSSVLCVHVHGYSTAQQKFRSAIRERILQYCLTHYVYIGGVR